jgi:hypothetical protein
VCVSGPGHATFSPGCPDVIAKGARIVAIKSAADFVTRRPVMIEGQHVTNVVEVVSDVLDACDPTAAKNSLSSRGPFKIVAHVTAAGRLLNAIVPHIEGEILESDPIVAPSAEAGIRPTVQRILLNSENARRFQPLPRHVPVVGAQIAVCDCHGAVSRLSRSVDDAQTLEMLFEGNTSAVDALRFLPRRVAMTRDPG